MQLPPLVHAIAREFCTRPEVPGAVTKFAHAHSSVQEKNRSLRFLSLRNGLTTVRLEMRNLIAHPEAHTSEVLDERLDKV